ncbi:MAG: RDD family protein [Planctomycetales bacterium]|nr:RDD family protein [Planctomycetales bacterium]
MTASSTQVIEFRCNRCWQPNYAELDQAETEINCAACDALIQVPAASTDRLREREAVTQPPVLLDDVSPSMSDAELMRYVERQNDVPLTERDFSGYPDASVTTRFIAFLIDTFVTIVAFGVAAILLFAAAQNGWVESIESQARAISPMAMVILYGIPLAVYVIQWNLIATRGQTIGKFVTCIRIVTCAGQVPGFIRGVVVRNWLRALLCVIPLFGLIDILCIFGSSRRCIHDFLAGTRVIEN